MREGYVPQDEVKAYRPRDSGPRGIPGFSGSDKAPEQAREPRAHLTHGHKALLLLAANPICLGAFPYRRGAFEAARRGRGERGRGVPAW